MGDDYGSSQYQSGPVGFPTPGYRPLMLGRLGVSGVGQPQCGRVSVTRRVRFQQTNKQTYIEDVLTGGQAIPVIRLHLTSFDII